MPSRLNNFVKFVMINANILLSFLGLFFFGFAFYLWFANWGDLYPGFFVGTGLIFALFGLSVTIVSCIGCQGINNQIGKYGFWTGRKIVALHLIVLIAILIAEVYLLKISLAASEQFHDVYTSLAADSENPPGFVDFEKLIAQKFNRFFFGAGSECKTALYYWFWNWIEGNCPSSMVSTHCQGCYSFSYTFCPADEATCFGDESYSNEACPYVICRSGILNYVHERIRPFAIVLLTLTLLQGIFILLDTMILCYHPRDTLETILYKSGTLSRPRQNAPSAK